MSKEKNNIYRDFSMVIKYLWTSRRKKEKVTYLRFATECIHTLALDRFAKNWLFDEVNNNKEEKITKDTYLKLVVKLTNLGYSHSIDALRFVSIDVSHYKGEVK